MSEFEFLAVLLSIVFGLALTQTLAGGVRLLFDDEIDYERMGWTLCLVTTFVVNWWGFFGWSDRDAWTFATYTFLMLWAIGHYVLAVSLFPQTLGKAIDPEMGERIFLIVFLLLMPLDVIEGLVRGNLFDVPLYLPAMAHWTLLLLYRLLSRPRQIVARAIAWYMFVSILVWALFARRMLVT